MTAPGLVLASTSAYRRALLSRLGLRFEVEAPGIPEVALPGETHAGLAQRLAREKAGAVAARYPECTVIGADQVAALGDQRLGKPGGRDRAIAQLSAASGRTVVFYTAVCVVSAARGIKAEGIDTTQVAFRRLDRSTIEQYIDREQPYDCAGSAKAEGLGIALVERIDSQDPTGLIGLPLILLTDLLARHGIALFPDKAP